jgi:parvulin-like peptidyl-prolyl isomerase
MWKWIPVALGVLALSAGTNLASAALEAKPAEAKPGAPAAQTPAKPKPDAAAGTTAAKPAPAAPKKPPFTLALLRTPQVAAATVNGEAISVGDLMLRLSIVGGSQILDRLVQEKILAQEARKFGIVLTPKEIQDRLDQNIRDFEARFGTPQRVQEYLDRQKLTREGIRSAMRPNVVATLWQEKLREKIGAKIEVPDKEIEEYYKAQQWQFTEPEKARLSHILVGVNSADAAEDQKAKAKAEEILAKIQAAEGKNFAEVAKESSDDMETKAKGGELPMINRPSFFGITFDQAVFGASPGLVPTAVRSVRGYHIVYLHEKVAQRVKPLDEVKATVKDRLVQQKRAEAFRAHMDQAQKGARTDIKFQF